MTLRKRVVIPPILLLVLLAGAMAFLALNHLAATDRSRAMVLHSHEVIETAQGLLAEVQDAETGQRGYLITQDPFYLDPYRTALRRVRPSIDRLRAMVTANPDQSRRVDELQGLVSTKLAELQQTIEMVRAGRVNEARAVVFTDRGNVAMDNIRHGVAAIIDDEERRLTERARQVERSEGVGLAVALAAGAAAILGLAFAIIALAAANRRLEQEMTQRFAAEEGLEESEAIHGAVFASSPDYLFVLEVTEDGRFVVSDANPALRQVFGEQSVVGLDMVDFAAANPSSSVLQHCRRVADSGKASIGRGLVQTARGPRIWETTLAPLRDPRGRVHRLVGVTRDITEREQAEVQRRKSQRLEAVGQLTGGVAHDFNNLLQVIRGNLELLGLKLKDADASTRQRIEGALHGADRAAQLTRQLLAFARRQPLEPRALNLGRLVGDMSEMLRRTLGESIEIETVVAGGLWNTLADPAQVESAVLNLAINARDAMIEGGRLTIEVTNAVLDDAYARQAEDVTPGQYVLLAVSDTGEGMSEDVLHRVFEPFFTTKAEEKGTGLGLAMVYGFVKQSHGHVQIYSEPGQGTTVKIYLPRSRAAPEQASAPPATPAGPALGGRERILLVEDDPGVRAAVSATLAELGYAAIEASDGQAAVEVLESGVAIDLLFTDVVMPGPVKSRDLAARAAELRPGLPVLFTSGYTENAIVHHGRLDEGVSLLSKPYSREALARKLKEVLHAARKVVLVVEDEALVRLSAVDMVEALGFAAIAAATAREALRALKGEGRIDILFTDVGLPDIKGPALAEQALALRPGLKVVLASGYASTGDASTPEDGYLAKPYDRDSLKRALG